MKPVLVLGGITVNEHLEHFLLYSRTTCRKSDTFITFIQSYPTRKVGLTFQLTVRLVLCERYSTVFERGNKQ